jgi:hypothetical protein
LLQVLQTAAGPVILGRPRQVSVWSTVNDDAEDPAQRVSDVRVERRRREQPVCRLLSKMKDVWIGPNHTGEPVLSTARVWVQCPCRQVAIEANWIREQLRDGKRRVVWEGSTTHID